MNIRDDTNIRNSAELKLAVIKRSSLHKQGGFFSTPLFFVDHRYRTQIEHLAGIDANESVALLIKQLDPYISRVDAASKDNPGLDETIASEFRELADHLYHAMKVLVQKCVARFDRKLLKLDLATNSVNRKIDDYRARAPELLNTFYVQAEFDLRRAISNEVSEKNRFERFRYRNKLQHRDARKLTSFTIMLISVFAVLLFGFVAAFISEKLNELFIGNRSQVFLFALAFVVANIIFAGVFVAWFGIRYLVHEQLARKLFPGVFCFSLGMLGIVAIAFYLCLLVAEIERLPSTTSDLGASATAFTAQHEADRQQAFNNAKAHFLNWQVAETSSEESLTIFLAILVSATIAYAVALQTSDIYPGYSAAAQVLKSAQNERRSVAVKGSKMIANEERNILADLRKSLRASESLVNDVESAVVSMKVLIGDVTHVTSAQIEGYRECVSLCCRSATEPYTGRDEESVELTGSAAAKQQVAAAHFTSALIAMRAESEDNLRELNVMTIDKSAAADTQLHRQKLTAEELDKLASEVKQCAAKYKSKLNRMQSET